jgi:hypothetical protein
MTKGRPVFAGGIRRLSVALADEDPMRITALLSLLAACAPLPPPGTDDTDDTPVDDVDTVETDVGPGTLRDLNVEVQRLVTGTVPEASITELDGSPVPAKATQLLAISREATAVEPYCPAILMGGCLALKEPVTWVTLAGEPGVPVGAGVVVPTGFPAGSAWVQGVTLQKDAVGISTSVAATVLSRNGDEDNDGLSNVDEDVSGTDLFDPDSDDDGLPDGADIAAGASPLDADSDDDGLGDAEEVAGGTDPGEADADGDGLEDPEELALGTDPNVADTDADGVRDGDEAGYGTNPLDADSDNDSLLDGMETALGSDPLAVDSDGDGRNDGIEVAAGTDPTASDTDTDGLDDRQEYVLGTDPLNPDSDADLLTDGEETDFWRTNPLVFDTDFDTIGDGDEAAMGTDPRRADTDSDGLPDGLELAGGTNALVADTDGDCLLDGDEATYGGDPRVDDTRTLAADISGAVDCADPACAGIPSCPELCNDAIDNDGDGATDCVDAGCDGSPQCIERACLDGADNDRDGLLDCEDDDCSESALCSEVACDDGNDNDQDGPGDCADPDCWNDSVCAPIVHVSSGTLRRVQDNTRRARACDVGQFPPPGTPPYVPMGVDYGSWQLSVVNVAGTVTRPGLGENCGFEIDRVAWREPEAGGAGPQIPTRTGFALDPACTLADGSSVLGPFVAWNRNVTPAFQIARFPARANGQPATLPDGIAYTAASAPGRNRAVSSSTSMRIDSNFFPSWCIFFNTFEQKDFSGPVTGP